MAASMTNRGLISAIRGGLRLGLINLCLFAIFARLLNPRRRVTMETLSSSMEKRYHSYGSPYPSIETKTATKLHDITGDTPTISDTVLKNQGSGVENNHQDEQGREFDDVLWPKIRHRICPRGVPLQSLAPTLFELGRIEMGIKRNINAQSEKSFVSENNTERTVSDFFFRGSFGFTVFIDGKDPTNTVLYTPIWKGANNQIHAYLHQVLNRKANGDVRRPGSSVGNPNDFYLEEVHNKDISLLFHHKLETMHQQRNGKSLGTDDTSDNDTDGFANQTAAESESEDDDDSDYFFKFNKTKRGKPCSFTVIRDPVSHFLSGYNEVEFRLIEGDSDAPAASRYDELAPYSRMAWNANIDSDDTNNELDLKLREDRFEQFVRDVLNEHPSFAKFPYYKHFASMTGILPILSKFDLLPAPIPSKPRTKANETQSNKKDDHDLWFLPGLENLTDVFPDFLAARCPRLAANYNEEGSANKLPPMPVRGRHNSSQDPYGTYKAAKDVWNKGGRVARALCHLHALDYACFSGSYNEYSRDVLRLPGLELPTVCREVYSSDSFRQAILSS